jgi:hypothetical protein
MDGGINYAKQADYAMDDITDEEYDSEGDETNFKSLEEESSELVGSGTQDSVQGGTRRNQQGEGPGE